MVIYVTYKKVNEQHIFSSLAVPELLTSEDDLKTAFDAVLRRLNDVYSTYSFNCKIKPIIPYEEWSLAPFSPVVFNVEFDPSRHY